MITFSCDLEVPRTKDSTGMPTSWARDREVSFDARGFLGDLLTFLPPSAVRTSEEVYNHLHPLNPPLVVVVSELEEAGYLERVPGEEEHYRLVHPDRLPPLPPAGVLEEQG